jgi:hypothetical protein
LIVVIKVSDRFVATSLFCVSFLALVDICLAGSGNIALVLGLASGDEGIRTCTKKLLGWCSWLVVEYVVRWFMIDCRRGK